MNYDKLQFNFDRLRLPIVPGGTPPPVTLTPIEQQAFFPDLNLGELLPNITHVQAGKVPITYCIFRHQDGVYQVWRDPKHDAGVVQQTKAAGKVVENNAVDKSVQAIIRKRDNADVLEGENGMYGVGKEIGKLSDDLDELVKKSTDVHKTFASGQTDPEVNPVVKSVIKQALPGISNTTKLLLQAKFQVDKEEEGIGAATVVAEQASPTTL